MVTTLLLAPPYTTENLTRVFQYYNPRPPPTHFSGTAVTIKKVLALRHSPAIPPYPHRWGAVDTNDGCISYPLKHNED